MTINYVEVTVILLMHCDSRYVFLITHYDSRYSCQTRVDKVIKKGLIRVSSFVRSHYCLDDFAICVLMVV